MCSYYRTESVLIALGITAAVCISISLFAIQTKVCTDYGLISGVAMWDIWDTCP